MAYVCRYIFPVVVVLVNVLSQQDHTAHTYIYLENVNWLIFQVQVHEHTHTHKHTRAFGGSTVIQLYNCVHTHIYSFMLNRSI